MLEYDQRDIFEGLDINRTSASKEFDICQYWYFLNKSFSYQLYLCNVCHDLMEKATSFDDVAFVSIRENDNRIHFWYMSKNDAISKMNNSNLNVKTGLL